METCKLSLQARSTGVGLGFKVTLDQQVIYDHVVGNDTVTIEHDFVDEENVDHELIVEMMGKTAQHTELDQQGNIVHDTLLEIQNLSLDGIDVTSVLNKITQYHHDSNGSQPVHEQEFFGVMGCNGRVSMKFSSPLYLWLLENI